MAGTRTTPRRGLPAALILFGLALVPLVGVAYLSGQEMGESIQTQSSVTQAEKLGQEAILLGEVRTALISERDWSLIVTGLDEVGLSSEVVRGVTDIDSTNEYRKSVRATDRLTAELESNRTLDPDLVLVLLSEIAELRSSEIPTSELKQRYDSPGKIIEDAAGETFADLEQLSASLPDGEDLTRSVRVLRAADQARIQIAIQQNALYATYFDRGQDLDVQYRLLIDSSSQYQHAITQIHELSNSDSLTPAALAVLESDPDVKLIQSQVDQKIDEVLAEGHASSGFTLAIMSQIVSEFQEIFTASITSVERHEILLQAASADLSSEAEALRQASDRQVRETMGIGGFFALIGLLAVAVANRALVRPLNRLAMAAESLTSGTRLGSGRIQGPIEVRAAAAAIQAAHEHLVLAEKQALALSNGSLDDASLNNSAGGELGASLQDAVQTLAESLKQSDEFSKRLQYEATHDGLTGLANRSAALARITETLADAAASDSQMAVMFIDLDGFKQINDRLGHRSGDEVLRVIAARLRGSIRPQDHVGRLGGDEFVVTLSPIAGIEQVIDLAQRLVRDLASPIDLESGLITVGASIGIADSSLYDTPLPRQILHDADLAVYQAKSQGKGRVVVCGSELRNESNRATALLEALGSAIGQNELLVEYQAVVTSESSEVCSLEALVRWNRPGHGVIPAEGFIELAGRSSLIVDIDLRVLELVIEQLVEWTDHPILGQTPISVNLAGNSLASSDFVELVLDRMDKAGIESGRLILEVKENTLFEHHGTAVPRLQRLRDHGIQIAIDNFGTGYTSLARMRHLPVDILKIDSTLVASVNRHPKDRDLIEMIMATGRLLGATILAEGIETPQQAKRMKELGTDQLQGHHISRPRSAREIASTMDCEIRD